MSKKKAERIRIGVTLSGDAAKAFREEVGKTLAPDAAFARLLINEGLERRGHTITDDVTWGGKRDSETGQPVGVGAI